jgi:hypothetical protein
MNTLLLLAMLLGAPQSQTGVIKGQVRFVDGRPAAEIRVAAMTIMNERAGPRVTVLAGQTLTDGAGRYELRDVPPGRYVIVVGRLERPTYYPGVTAPGDARPVDVRPQQTVTGVDLSLPNLYSVSGRARRAANLPASEALHLVLIPAGDDPAPREGAVKPDGSFRFTELAPGAYTLRRGTEGMAFPPINLVVTDRDLNGIELNVQPGIPITGKLEFDGVPVLDELQLSQLEFGLALSQNGQVLHTAMKWSGDSFATDLEDAGNYAIRWGKLPPAYAVSAVRAGGLDLLRVPLPVDRNSELPPIVITIGVNPEAAVKVSGRVINPPGNPRATAVTLSAGGGKVEALIQADGSFEFPKVLPLATPYRIGVGPHAAFDPSTAVTVASRNVSGLEITLPVVREIRGRVEGEGILPEPNLLIRVSNSRSARFSVSPVWQPDGVFTVFLPEGTLDLQLEASGYLVDAFSYGSTNLLLNRGPISPKDSTELRVTLSAYP